MKLLLVGISLLILGVILGIYAGRARYKKNLTQLIELKREIKLLTNIVNSARYGNLQARIENENNPFINELAKSINSLLESILDRDDMIKEYIQSEKESHALKEDFIATLTHDLKVPIIAQDNTFDLLLAGKFGEITAVQNEVTKRLKISNMDLKHLIETLLETYKMEQAGIVVKKDAAVDLTAFLTEIIEQIRPVAILHNKSINFQNEAPSLHADIDKFLIRRVVNNLILNALSHSINSDNIDIILKKVDDIFEISIKDYGVGIDKNEIEKIFNKYYSGSRKFAKSGTGLGLYLSNKIILQNNGAITVQSIEEQGSTFTITLPLK